MAKANGTIILILIIAGIGLIGALMAGHEFAGPFGGILGLLVGPADSVYQTLKTPKNLRNMKFTTLVGGRYGAPFRNDARFLFTLIMAVLCAFSALLWQTLLW